MGRIIFSIALKIASQIKKMRNTLFLAVFASLLTSGYAAPQKKTSSFVKYPRSEDEETQRNAINEGMGGSRGSSAAYATDSTDGEEQAESHSLRNKHIESISEGDEDLEAPESQPEGGLGSEIEKEEQLIADEEATNPSGAETSGSYAATREQSDEAEEQMSPPTTAAPIQIPQVTVDQGGSEVSDDGKNVEIHNNNCGGCLSSKKTKLVAGNPSHVQELKEAVNELYDRARKVNLTSETPQMQSMGDVEKALGVLEGRMNNDEGAASTSEASSTSESAEIPTEEFRQIHKKKNFSLSRKLRPHRFAQQDDEDEEEEEEREEALDEAEEELEDKKKEDAEEEAAEEKPKKLSLGEAKQKLLSSGQLLERIIGSIVSSNSGIPDLLGTQARQKYLKENPIVPVSEGKDVEAEGEEHEEEGVENEEEGEEEEE